VRYVDNYPRAATYNALRFVQMTNYQLVRPQRVFVPVDDISAIVEQIGSRVF
jgi:hypothetical protein